jgi:hypothetical protein
MSNAGKSRLRWRKSSRSAAGNCVEVARLGGIVLVRDSKNPDGPRMRFDARDWSAFIGTIGTAAGRDTTGAA